MSNPSCTVGQIIALNHILTEWPMKYGFDTIFNMIHLGETLITIQENFEDWNVNTLYEFAKNLAEDIDKEIALAMR